MQRIRERARISRRGSVGRRGDDPRSFVVHVVEKKIIKTKKTFIVFRNEWTRDATASENKGRRARTVTLCYIIIMTSGQ